MQPTQELYYTESRHSFFNELATMIFSLFAHTYTTHIFHVLNGVDMNDPKQPTAQPLRDIARPLKTMGFCMAFDANSSNDSFVFMMMWLQASINLGSWPNFIEYYRIIGAKLVPQQTFRFTTKDTFYRQVVSSAFVTYFEAQLPQIVAKHGTNRPKWRGIVNFARIIRNGFAHNGLLKIGNSEQPETWRNWTFGPADSGKEFFMTPDGLAIGDIILLFEELHQELYP